MNELADRTLENHFLVFSRTRSGTTVFGRLLGSSASIYCYDEVLNTKHEINYYNWLSPRVVDEPERIYPARWESNFLEYVGHLELSAKAAKPTTIFTGWDIKVENLPQYVKEWGATFSMEFLDFVANSGVSIVYLRRQNVLRRHLSNVLAHHRKVFHRERGSERIESEKIELDARAALRMCLHAYAEDDTIEDYVRAKDRAICLYYEDLFEMNEEGQIWAPPVIQRLSAHFNISDLDPVPRLQKVAPESLRGTLSNYDEIREVFARKHIAWMVED